MIVYIYRYWQCNGRIDTGVNDFRTVYLERNTESVGRRNNGGQLGRRKKGAKSLEVFGRSTRLFIVVSFVIVSLWLLSRIFFGVVPFFSRGCISVY